MDLTYACNVLEISLPFNAIQLKKAYHRSSLKYHPDKNSGQTTKKFQEIRASYDFLCVFLEVQQETPIDNTYNSIFKEYLTSMLNIDSTNTNLFDNIINGCKNLSLKAFEGINKQTSINIYGYLKQYADILNITDDVLESIRIIIKEKLQNDELIIIKSTINNCINAEIYVLEHNDDMFYVPLWHEELTFDLSYGSLEIKCIPELPDHISLDNNNNLHINICTSIVGLLDKDTLDVNVGEKVFKIPIKKLNIQKHQTYIFSKQGVPIINIKNIYNDKILGDIIVHIELNN